MHLTPTGYPPKKDKSMDASQQGSTFNNIEHKQSGSFLSESIRIAASLMTINAKREGMMVEKHSSTADKAPEKAADGNIRRQGIKQTNKGTYIFSYELKQSLLFIGYRYITMTI